MGFQRLWVCGVMLLATAVGCGGSDSTGGGETEARVVGLRFEEIDLGDEATTVTGFRFVPGTTDEILLMELNGTVRHYRIEGTGASELGTFVVPNVLEQWDCGLLSMTFDLDWANNHLVYFGHCLNNYTSRVARITFDGSNYSDAAGTAAVVIDVASTNTSAPVIHAVGSLGMETDGTLWFTHGDKGSQNTAQDTSLLLGALLRVVPDRSETGSGYTMATGNPYNGTDGATEVYAKGIRHAFRATRSPDGAYWFGDVGGGSREEVNRIPSAGLNFGWPTCEGPCDPSMDGFTDPLTSWARDTDHPYFQEDPDTEPTTGRAAWVGQWHSGHASDPYEGLLTDKLVFGDICLGWVRTMVVGESGEVTSDISVGHLSQVTDWVPGPDGYVYATTFGTCDNGFGIKAPGLWRAVPRVQEVPIEE